MMDKFFRYEFVYLLEKSESFSLFFKEKKFESKNYNRHFLRFKYRRRFFRIFFVLGFKKVRWRLGKTNNRYYKNLDIFTSAYRRFRLNFLFKKLFKLRLKKQRRKKKIFLSRIVAASLKNKYIITKKKKLLKFFFFRRKLFLGLRRRRLFLINKKLARFKASILVKNLVKRRHLKKKMIKNFGFNWFLLQQKRSSVLGNFLKKNILKNFLKKKSANYHGLLLKRLKKLRLHLMVNNRIFHTFQRDFLLKYAKLFKRGVLFKNLKAVLRRAFVLLRWKIPYTNFLIKKKSKGRLCLKRLILKRHLIVLLYILQNYNILHTYVFQILLLIIKLLNLKVLLYEMILVLFSLILALLFYL